MFNDFKDTIFYKSDSEIEYKVKALELLKLEYPDNVQVKKELKECKKELKNEEEIEKVLEKSNIGMYVIRDLNINYKDLKVQIDYVVITQGFIYLIECQKLYGNIIINSNGEFLKKVKKGEETLIEKTESPITVGDKYKTILKKLWSSKINIKDKKRFEEAFEKSYKVIAVANSSNSNIVYKNTPSNIKSRIIKSERLLKYIKEDLEMFSTRKDLIDNKDEMHGQAYKLMEFNVDSNTNWEQKYRKLFKLKPIILVAEKKKTKLKEKTKKDEEVGTPKKSKKTLNSQKVKVPEKKDISKKIINTKKEVKQIDLPKPKKVKIAKEAALKNGSSKKTINKETSVLKAVKIAKVKPDDQLNKIKELMTISSVDKSNEINVKLKKMLMNYRQKKYKENNVPDYYIFTDEELNILLSKKPKSVEELKRKKILTPVKIRMFGEDIVKIIKKVDI